MTFSQNKHNPMPVQMTKANKYQRFKLYKSMKQPKKVQRVS